MPFRSLRDRRQRPLRIVVDARIQSGKPGGIEGIIIGLANGLAALTDSDDEYIFLCIAGEESFLKPFLGTNARVEFIGQATVVQRVRRRARRALLGPPPQSAVIDPNVPPFSDGTVERLQADLVHFTAQAGFRTLIPTIYHPHDLQHLHLPQFFSPELIAWREGWYRALCKQAAMVAVASSWTKHDVEEHYGLPPGRVRVVRMAPATSAFRTIDTSAAQAIRTRLGVPERYVLYPAQTWPHKNHAGLLRAVAELRDRDSLIVPLVAPGKQNEHFGNLSRLQEELGLEGQVLWPGFITPDELTALYDGALAVVIPTLFEAASFPLWEAFAAGVPAACSNVTALPEQAGDAALVFDPHDVASIANSVRRLWTEPELRATLAERGRRKVSDLSWISTARTFRAHYRRITGRGLSPEDEVWLADHDPHEATASGARDRRR
jgi:glycosyltransferase involved in cell wall biosynthesis